MRERLRRRWFLIVAIFAVLLGPTALRAEAQTTSAIVFSYGYDYVGQTVDISSFAGSMTTVSATVSVKQVQYGPDRIAVKLLFRNGEGQQVHSLNDPVQYETAPVEWGDITFVADLSAFDTSSWTEMVVEIWGKDGENWGGNYGTAVESISLSINETDQTSLLVNPDFSSVTSNAPDGWSSSQGWDTCQGLSTATLCVGNLAAPTPVPETTTTTSTTTTTTTAPTEIEISGQGTEGARQFVNLSAPEGYVFTRVVFASYGLPENFTINESCHATTSESVVAELALGNSSVSINVTNEQFGEDPCGGIQKRLQVILAYSADTTPTTTTTTTAPVPNFLGSPTNVSVVPEESGLLISWDAATDDTGVSPERYAISWSTGQSGWGVATGNVGDENALNTQILLGYSLFESTGGLDAEYSFTVRADNDTNAVYSQPSAPVVLAVSTPTTTTTTAPTTTTTTVPPTTTTQAPPPPPAPPPVTSAAPTTAPPTTAPPTTAPETTAPATTAPETTPAPTTAPQTTTKPTTTVAIAPATTINQTPTTEVSPATTTATTSPETTVPEPTTDPESQTPQNEEIEKVVAEAEKLLEDLANEDTPSSLTDAQETLLLNAIDSGQLSQQEIKTSIELIVGNGVTEEQALTLSTNAVALNVSSDEVLDEIFSSINIEDVSTDEALLVIEAVQGASDVVKESFEDNIDIFEAGIFDTYIPLGSSVSVAERRVIIAVTATLAAVAASVPASGRGNSRKQ